MDEPPIEELNIVGFHVLNYLHNFSTLGGADE